MTLFGRSLDAQDIAALVSLLLVLVLWIGVWRGDNRESRWLRAWNAERKARRDAEIAAEQGETGAPAEDGRSRGPWG